MRVVGTDLRLLGFVDLQHGFAEEFLPEVAKGCGGCEAIADLDRSAVARCAVSKFRHGLAGERGVEFVTVGAISVEEKSMRGFFPVDMQGSAQVGCVVFSVTDGKVGCHRVGFFLRDDINHPGQSVTSP